MSSAQNEIVRIVPGGGGGDPNSCEIKYFRERELASVSTFHLLTLWQPSSMSQYEHGNA